MKDQIDKLTDRLTEVSVHLGRIDERLSHYNESLDEHIRRTAILEANMETALLPIKVLKTVGSVLAGAAALAAILKAMGKL